MSQSSYKKQLPLVIYMSSTTGVLNPCLFALYLPLLISQCYTILLYIIYSTLFRHVDFTNEFINTSLLPTALVSEIIAEERPKHLWSIR